MIAVHRKIWILMVMGVCLGFGSNHQVKILNDDVVQPGEVTINGHINHYSGTYTTGRLEFWDAVTGLDNAEIFFIDSAGDFKLTFELLHPIMTSFIQIDKVIFALYLEPGETYSIIVNDDGTQNFTGKNSEVNNHVFMLEAAVRKRFKKDIDKQNLYHKDHSNDFEGFEMFCNDLSKRELEYIDEYGKNNKLNEKATELVKLDIGYEPAWALTAYRWILLNGKMRKRTGIPENFYRNLYEKYEINRPEAIGCRNYQAYISNISDCIFEDYRSGNEIIEYLINTKKFSDREIFMIKNYFRNDAELKNSKEFIEFFDERKGELWQCCSKYCAAVLMDSIPSFQPGLGRDLIVSKGISRLYFSNPIISPSAEDWERMESLISNKNITGHLRKIDQYNLVKATRPNPDKANFIPSLLDTEANKTYELLIGKYKGKVVYIDFWATWCGPCRSEIPYSEMLINHFKGQDVVFLFLCNRSDRKAWENTIRSEQMTGEHYLLNNDEYNFLSNLFKIIGVPTYALVDRKGNIVNPKAPRPSEGQITIEAIEALLKN